MKKIPRREAAHHKSDGDYPEAESRRWKQFRQMLEQDEDVYKKIWESSLSGLYLSQDGIFQAVSPLITSFTGYRVEELIGKKADSIIYPEDIEGVRKNVRETLSGKRMSPYEFRIVTKQGKICWVLETITATLFKGRPAILGNFMDISERKAVENLLKESETLYRAIFETTGAATVIIEDDMTVTLINSEFERMTGYRKEDWEGKKKWPEYIAPKDIPRMIKSHKLRRIDPKAPPRTFEHDLVDSRGRIRHMVVVVDLIPGTKRSVSSFFDVTAWKEAERGLKKREQELRAQSRNLKELNTALRVLLKQRENDRAEFEDVILSNVKELVLPYVEKIQKSNTNTETAAYIDIVASNLKDIISPFSHRISAKHSNLTQREILIASFIKEGKTSKEIADILNISKSAIDIHRFRLRKKLGLNNKKVDLRTHLINFS